jgi:hypothetical protein
MQRRDNLRLFALDLAAVSRELFRLAREADQTDPSESTIDSGTLRDLAERLQRWAESSARQLGDTDLAREVAVRHQAFQAWEFVAARLQD